MLVLSRRLGEALQIGDDVELVILGVSYGQVRIGIKAPREVNVVRTELLSRPQPIVNPQHVPLVSSGRTQLSRKKYP